MKHCRRCKRTLPLCAFGKHSGHSDGLQSICKTCKARADAQYYGQNKTRKATYDKERRRKETLADRDRRNEQRRRHYASNPEPRRRNNKAWRQRNPDKVMLQVQQRRARIKKAMGHFSSLDWQNIKEMFQNRCAYCEEQKELTVDHIIPLVKGGSHDKHNIVPACINCNSQKHISVWPIMTRRSEILRFYAQTLEDAKRMAIAFAESES